MHVDAEYIHFMYVLFINLIDVNSHYFIFPTVEVFYIFIHYSYTISPLTLFSFTFICNMALTAFEFVRLFLLLLLIRE